MCSSDTKQQLVILAAGRNALAVTKLLIPHPMSSKNLFQRIVELRSSTTEFRECRHCGCSIEKDSGECPECGSNEIAAYDL